MVETWHQRFSTLGEGALHWLKSEALLYFGMVCWAVGIVVMGLWGAFLLRKRMRRVLEARSVEPTIRGFLTQIVFVGVITLVAVLALSRLGVQMASVVAVIASVSFALVLALQGSLSHVASGIVLVIMRPFKVGDYIETAGIAGTVQSIEIMFTHLRTSDCRAITVPNSKVLSDAIINYSVECTRRVELPFMISYQDSIEHARTTVLDVLKDIPNIQTQPDNPTVWVKSLDDNGVSLLLRYWTHPKELPILSYRINEAVKLAFDREGIIIPYPQREIRMFSKTQ